ncbi:MAG: hypothetical protein GY758_14515 [Fuerstiella sp.]|nr:hypothetical protein [Fuerstiella sp.]MCP4509967.1 hypothetical protein [Fuerstiella sp.]
MNQRLLKHTVLQTQVTLLCSLVQHDSRIAIAVNIRVPQQTVSLNRVLVRSRVSNQVTSPEQTAA